LAVDADASRATLNRVSDTPNRLIRNLDLRRAEDKQLRLADGDFIAIDPILPVVDGQVEVMGHVHRPGKRALQPGMRVTDLIPDVTELKPFADTAYALIVSIDRQNAELSSRSVNLRDAWAARESVANPELRVNDQVIIFERNKPRGPIMERVLQALREQASGDVNRKVIRVSGAVKVPGDYPHETGMTVSDMLRAAGGVAQEAYTLRAELLRQKVDASQIRKREIIEIDLESELSLPIDQSQRVVPFDELLVKVIPEWSEDRTIELLGEVVFPGVYPIAPGETLRSVITRAGGLKQSAFAEAAFFSRRSLREKDVAQIEKLQADLRRGIALAEGELARSTDKADAAKLQSLRPLLEEGFQDNPALGRLAIDLQAILDSGGGSDRDIPLMAGDRLLVPPKTPEISVYGEVFSQGSFVAQRGATIDDYIRLAGGYRTSADVRNVYIVRASGQAAPVGGSRRGKLQFKAGDSIIVPYRIPRVRNPFIETLAQSSQVIYNLALGAAALRAVNP
jgi:polysaccharide export outer membrane protein